MAEETVDAGQSAGAPDDEENGESGQSATAAGEAEETGQSASESSSDTVSRAEFERLRNQLSAADKKREDAEKRLGDIADKDKTELERATERAKALEAELAKERAAKAVLTLEKSLLADPEYGSHRWHDPEDVLTRLGKAVESDSISVADDGTPDPKSVKKWLKNLAAERKYLLKDSEAAPPADSSGAPVGSGKRNGETSADSDKQLRSKYKIR